MNRKQLIFAAFAIIAITLLYFTLTKSDNNEQPTISSSTYEKQITAERQQKNNFFETSAESPIVDKNHFSGLTYYPPDISYRVSARLEPFADKTQKMAVKLSDGSEEIYEKFAHAVFSLQGKVHRLLIVKQNSNLSILFRDATANQETYGGGRYIDIQPEAISETQLILDFNTSYNPYCAYNPDYACPLPPDENTLTIPIRAGEKYVHKD